jgi:hypothetical protein
VEYKDSHRIKVIKFDAIPKPEFPSENEEEDEERKLQVGLWSIKDHEHQVRYLYKEVLN